jgi:Leucine-rich repeat (LRR) protein
MKKYLLLLLLVSFSIEAQNVNIPDANFKAKLLLANPSNNIAQNQFFQNIKIDVNNDGEIQQSEANLVYVLDVRNSSISNLGGITNFNNLRTLTCMDNQIASLNLSGMTSLITLSAQDCQIQNINLENCTNLYVIDLTNNFLTTFGLNDLNNLHIVNLGNNLLNNINFQNVISSEDPLSSVRLSNNPLGTVNINNSNLKSISSENSPISEISFINSEIQNLSLEDTNLQILDLSFISELNYLRIYNNINLNFELNIINCNQLEVFSCNYTNLTLLDLSGCFNLKEVYLEFNQLFEVFGLNDCIELLLFDCQFNDLESLNFSGLENLQQLYCNNNSLIEINLEGCSSISSLICENNQLISLDLSSCYNLNSLLCNYNQLEYLNLKNGNNQSSIFFYEFYGNPIVYVCANENQVNSIQTYIDDYFLSGHVNSYCSFVPGGTYYTLQGQSKIDTDNNGCTESDLNFPNMKFNITNGTISGNIISNASGNYSIPVQAGTHTAA